MLALENIKILDLCRRYPGSLACMILGDFGARVLKVDAPGAADVSADVLTPGFDARQGGPHSDDRERLAAFMAFDRNKRSMVLDLKAEAGQQVLHRLVSEADVIVENFRPGVMKRLNCDYESLRKVNPRLIYCACSGYGQDGPYAMMPGHDQNYTALSGALSMIGPKDGPPSFPSVYLGDMAGCGLHATIGILIALAARERTNTGQFVDISYMDGVMTLMTWDLVSYLYSGQVPHRGETPPTGAVLWCHIYRCKDGGYFTVAAAEQHLWENFCRTLDRMDLVDKLWARGEEKDRYVAELQEIFSTKTRAEWFEIFKQANVPATPVNDFAEAVQDPQVRHRRMIVEVDDPKLGKVPQPGIAIKLSSTPGSIRSLGVPVGVHTPEVLNELGYSTQEINQLTRQGAFGKPT